MLDINSTQKEIKSIIAKIDENKGRLKELKNRFQEIKDNLKKEHDIDNEDINSFIEKREEELKQKLQVLQNKITSIGGNFNGFN